jgi:NAD(P)-dependent dehydrogenase (short-subunit alcohol dehydrogenase family)
VTKEELVEVTAINFFAQFRICQRAVPLTMALGGGRVADVTKWERKRVEREFSPEDAAR